MSQLMMIKIQLCLTKCFSERDFSSNKNFKHAIDVKELLNYPSENDIVRELAKDEGVIQKVLDILVNGDQDPDDNCVLPNVS